MKQVVALELQIPVSAIRVANNSSDTLGHIVTGTGGSTGTETCCAALVDACRQIKQRCKEICVSKNWPIKTTSLREIAGAALGSRVPLSAYGYASTHNPSSSTKSQQGGWKYWVWGVACVEVEVDIRTGMYEFLHASMCQDVGKSFNTAVDIGQTEGGFMMALSWCTQEQVLYNEQGCPVSDGAESYYIATPSLVPREFNVALMPNVGNPANKKTQYQCKGTGEPPYCLGSCGYLALQRVVNLVRGPQRPYEVLCLPATPQEVRRAMTAGKQSKNKSNAEE